MAIVEKYFRGAGDIAQFGGNSTEEFDAERMGDARNGLIAIPPPTATIPTISSSMPASSQEATRGSAPI